MRQVVRGYLATHPCKDCGYHDPRALHFHHRDPSTKKFEVGKIANNGGPLNVLLIEIEKCDILCANCHSVHHQRERGWWIKEFDSIPRGVYTSSTVSRTGQSAEKDKYT